LRRFNNELAFESGGRPLLDVGGVVGIVWVVNSCHISSTD
jgi:hypothetical protein